MYSIVIGGSYSTAATAATGTKHHQLRLPLGHLHSHREGGTACVFPSTHPSSVQLAPPVAQGLKIPADFRADLHLVGSHAVASGGVDRRLGGKGALRGSVAS